MMNQQPDPQKQLRAAQDMLVAVSNQRNAAQNECVQLAAEIMELRRQLEAVAPKEGEILPPKANGHAEAPALQELLTQRECRMRDLAQFQATCQPHDLARQHGRPDIRLARVARFCWRESRA